jgi:hypothetical protein
LVSGTSLPTSALQHFHQQSVVLLTRSARSSHACL